MNAQTNSNELSEAVKPTGKNMTAFGVVAIVLGILAMLAPGVAGLYVAMLLGIVMLVAGLLRIFWALQSGSLGRGMLRFLIGALTLICGIALLTNPLFASGVISIVLAVYFILDGISEVAAGAWLGVRSGGGWLLLGGAISILFGVLIWRQYPLSGAWAMGILLGLKLFFSGLIMIKVGSAVRSLTAS